MFAYELEFHSQASVWLPTMWRLKQHFVPKQHCSNGVKDSYKQLKIFTKPQIHQNHKSLTGKAFILEVNQLTDFDLILYYLFQYLFSPVSHSQSWNISALNKFRLQLIWSDHDSKGYASTVKIL